MLKKTIAMAGALAVLAIATPATPATAAMATARSAPAGEDHGQSPAHDCDGVVRALELASIGCG